MAVDRYIGSFMYSQKFALGHLPYFYRANLIYINMNEQTYLEKLDAIIASPERYDLPKCSVVLCEYLRSFRPENCLNFSQCWEKSTSDIQNDLADMVQIEMNEIVTVLLLLGYHCKQFYVVNYMWEFWLNDPCDRYD